MKHTLTVTEDTGLKLDATELTIPMPGGVWTQTGFVVFEGATEAQLHKSVRQMNKLNLSSAWALGDLGIAIQERKLEEYLAEAEAKRAEAEKLTTKEDAAKRDRLIKQAEELEDVKLQHYTRELAEALGVDAGYWWNCVSLARFWEPSSRNEGLTPKHHIAAMRAAGGTNGKLATAKQWIMQATKDALTASELRKQVNLSIATARPSNKQAETNVFAELDAADHWCMTHKELAIGKDYAKHLLTRWQSLSAFIDQLKIEAAKK